MTSLRLHHVPGAPDVSGFEHGRQIGDLLSPAFRAAYVSRLAEVIRFTPDDLRVQAVRWLESLPSRYQEEIAGMGAGAGIGTTPVAEFLYADIARATEGTSAPTPRGERLDAPLVADGPMCSALLARLDDRSMWIGRNCDWLVPTLMRGTAAVVHEIPHRIPVMAVGIRGDIDVDTGINAERLWLHLHTLQARDDPPADRTCISWLFWAREALETCASLDELDAFVASTGRDRGVFAIAGDGKTNEAAIFECSRAGHVRHDVDPASVACVTNHALERDPDGRRGGRVGGTIGRLHALQTNARARPPRRGPGDLIEHLAATDVEMHSPRWLRTIYSAAVRLRDAQLWFAAGGVDGTPAASGGRWIALRPPWEQRAARVVVP
jgi:hypothetical protein